LREEINDEVRTDLVSAVKGNSAVVKQIREAVIDAFNNSLMRRIVTYVRISLGLP